MEDDARGAFVQLDADGRRVEVNDGELGLLVEADRRRAERELRAPAALGREAIPGYQWPVGKFMARRFLRALEGDLAFHIREAHDAIRRIGGLAPGEARCREREYQQGRAQQHGESIIRPGFMNGG